MKTAHIIYWNYLNPSGDSLSIGGVQTYLTNLIEVLKSIGYRVVVYQRGDCSFNKYIDDYLEVIGFARKRGKVRGLKHLLYAKARNNIDLSGDDIIVFGSEEVVVKTDGRVPVITIQHGISWDVPEVGLSKFMFIYRYLKKQYNALRKARILRFCDHLVCVDCNFINWYRALVPYPQVSMYYIPNFSAVPERAFKKPDATNGINIIFARRFVEKRGTRLFMSVLKRLLFEYDNLKATIAGEGPDEELLKKCFENDSRVLITRYESHESLSIHSDKHIAVIPTLGSEGTSLSLLEAMAAGCAVVCTNVGGMTNIIVNEYNGLMIAPDEEDLYSAIKRLIDNDEEREEMARRGYESLVASFSLDKWRKAWVKVFSSINGEKKAFFVE